MGTQLPLFQLPSKWTPPREFPSWANAKRVAVDCETRDPTLKELGSGAGRRKNSYIVGISYAIEDGPAGYLPFRHQGGDNLPEEAVLRYLRDQAKVYTGDIAGANLPYDLDFMSSDKIDFDGVKFFRDVQIADPLIYELEDSYSLENISKRYGFEGKHTDILQNALRHFGLSGTKDLWKLPARYVGEYGEFDSRLPLKILRKQERILEDNGQWKVYDLESRLVPILTKMRRKGIRIHLGRLAQIEAWSVAQEMDALNEVFSLCGVRIAVGDVNKAEVLAVALRAIGFHPSTTKNGLPHIDQAVLDSLHHPVADAIKRAKKVNKLRTTFAESVRNHMTPDGRIHCIYNQLRKQKDDDQSDDVAGGRYGRVSCEHPNLQQQPSRDEFASAWRAIYLPEEGEIWASCDYSQQEPRMAVHYACLSEHLIGHDAWLKAMEARDRYRNDPSTDNHQMMADMIAGRIANKEERKAAKEIFLGLAYGMGGAKLCRKLGLPTRMVVRGQHGMLFDVQSEEGRKLLSMGGQRFEAAGLEGQALIDQFNINVPFVRKMARACEQRAKQIGYITTIAGQRCHFPKDNGTLMFHR